MLKSDVKLPFGVTVRHFYEVEYEEQITIIVTSSLNEILSLWDSSDSIYQCIEYTHHNQFVSFRTYNKYTTELLFSSLGAFDLIINNLAHKLSKVLDK